LSIINRHFENITIFASAFFYPWRLWFAKVDYHRIHHPQYLQMCLRSFREENLHFGPLSGYKIF
jgi:hypothetical protein